MIGNSNLSTNNHLPADMHRARDSNLGHYYGILSDYHIVGHMNKIVCFYASLYPCLARGSPVNTAISTYFHIVINLNHTYLRDLDRHRPIPNKSKSITPYDSSSINNDIFPDLTIMQDRYIWINNRSVSDLDPITNENAGEHNNTVPYQCLFSHINQRVNGHILSNAGTIV